MINAGRLLQRRGLPPEGREIADSDLFDVTYYGERCGVHFATLSDAISHFLAAEHPADPHPLFSMDWYRSTYPDVTNAGMNPFVHFLRHGAQEGRSPSAYFDTRFYLDTYPDVAAHRLNALAHYINHGATEGRDPSNWFGTSDYLAAHGDVASAGVNALEHYVRHGEAEGRKLSNRPFKLDARYGMPEPSFARWRERSVGRPRNIQRNPALRELVVVASGSAVVHEKIWDDVRNAAAALRISLILETIDNIGRLAERATSASLVFFVESGDCFDRAGIDALLANCPEDADLVVFDMFYRHDGSVYPVFQPGANPQYIRSADSVFSRFAINGALLRQIADTGVKDARQILLAALDRLEAETLFGGMHHIDAAVLETPSLQATIQERRQGLVLADEVGAVDAASKPREASVSVVVCTKDNGILVDQLLAHLTTRCPAIKEIFIVSNQTTNFLALRTLQRWESHQMVKIIHYPHPFNFSDQCNVAVAQASGDLLLFLNDDIIGLNAVWLDRLVAAMAEPGVGIVGPRLLYPNECVQHAGMFLGFHGTAGHTMRHARLPEDDYLFMATGSRDVSCVTGAVLLVRRSTFEDLGGFDIQLRTAYQDVDLCLRVRGLGQRILYVPTATLLHLESVTVNTLLLSEKVLTQRLSERAHFLRLYEDGRLQKDPFHNGAYDLNDESLRTLVRF